MEDYDFKSFILRHDTVNRFTDADALDKYYTENIKPLINPELTTHQNMCNIFPKYKEEVESKLPQKVTRAKLEPNCDVICPKCKQQTIYTSNVQRASADENSDSVFECIVCPNVRWSVYNK